MKTITKENLIEAKEKVFSSNYKDNENLIESILKLYPYNNDETIVSMKIALIDSINSTHLSTKIKKISINNIAKIIINSDFDKILKEKNLDECQNLAENIIKKINKSYGVNLFSFISKYCCYHSYYLYKKDYFSIYDETVKSSLKNYINEPVPKPKRSWSGVINSMRNNMEYCKFNDLITNIIKDLEEDKKNNFYKRRYFDYYIWWNSKEND